MLTTQHVCTIEDMVVYISCCKRTPYIVEASNINGALKRLHGFNLADEDRQGIPLQIQAIIPFFLSAKLLSYHLTRRFAALCVLFVDLVSLVVSELPITQKQDLTPSYIR